MAMFVLLRHCHAGDKRRWRGPDDQRPLSTRGRVEARSLASLLADLGVRRLLSSPTRRCQQSLAPAMTALELPVEPHPALALGASAEDLLVLLESPIVDSAALCTHGEVLRALSEAWGRSRLSGLPDGGLSGTPKGAAWVVSDYPGAAASARYIAPLSARADSAAP
jgi:phosphohistidine phosphatase SixA